MSRLMWKPLFGLIYVLNEISFGNCIPKKRAIPAPLEVQIREKREAAEQQHYVNYLANEGVYRNWPEVHENPKYDCERFLGIIFPMKKDINSATPAVQKVILNYKQIRDENNNIPTPRSVTALECKLSKPVRARSFIYFIRSPQSPDCALFLNRIGRRSINFYIVENICEYRGYFGFWKFVEELKEDKLEVGFSENISKIKRMRQKMLLLPKEEMKAKHAEFEQKHYDYCSMNEGMCKFWPEIDSHPVSYCQKFFRRLLPENKDLSVITALLQPVKLRYLEIRNENNMRHDSVIVKAIACRLPHPVKGRRHVNFIRAPAYPICVFLVFWRKSPPQHVYIAKEICNTPDRKLSLTTIYLEHEKVYSPVND